MKYIDGLCIHTITTKNWPIELAVKKYRAAGIKGISVWRDALINRDPVQTGRMIKEEGMEVVSLVRGGFFPNKSKAERRKAIDENKLVLEEAASISAPMVVLVCGAEPQQPLEDSREQIFEGISELIPMANDLGVKLGIEPLHPMYADTRSAINTIKQANNIAEKTGSDLVGVVVDVYHLWWDPELENEIIRCAELEKLFAFHICDWKLPTNDFLNDREIMGKGCIPISRIHKWVKNAGFDGYNEVEIFSNEYWQMDQDEYLKEIVKAYNRLKL